MHYFNRFGYLNYLVHSIVINFLKKFISFNILKLALILQYKKSFTLKQESLKII